MNTQRITSALFSVRAIPVYITIGLFGVVIYLTQFHWTTEQLAGFISKSGPFGIFAYILLILLANIAAPISASPFLLLGFSLYGQWAIWLFTIGNIGAMAVNFLLARRYGRSVVAFLAGQSSLDKIDELSQNYGLMALFMVRIFLPGVSDLASYAFGLSKINFKPYIIVSIIATFPTNILFHFFTDQDNSSVELLLLQLLIAGALSSLYLAIRYLTAKFKSLLLRGHI